MRTALVCVRTPLAAQSITTCASRLGVSAVRTAVSEAEAVARLREGPVELILVDTAVTRPDTVGFTRRALALAPQAVLVFFGPEDPQVASNAVAAGARGVIRGSDQDLVAVVAKALLLIGASRRSVAGESAGQPRPASPAPAGGSVADRSVASARAAADRLTAGLVAAPSAASDQGEGRTDEAPAKTALVPAQRGDLPGTTLPRVAPLTERELQVLRGMAEGKSNAEIGRELFVSEDTVKTHARRLFRKLRARDRAHAVAVGFRAGVLG